MLLHVFFCCSFLLLMLLHVTSMLFFDEPMLFACPQHVSARHAEEGMLFCLSLQKLAGLGGKHALSLSSALAAMRA